MRATFVSQVNHQLFHFLLPALQASCMQNSFSADWKWKISYNKANFCTPGEWDGVKKEKKKKNTQAPTSTLFSAMPTVKFPPKSINAACVPEHA